jgi:hypothetical protein
MQKFPIIGAPRTFGSIAVCMVRAEARQTARPETENSGGFICLFAIPFVYWNCSKTEFLEQSLNEQVLERMANKIFLFLSIFFLLLATGCGNTLMSGDEKNPALSPPVSGSPGIVTPNPGAPNPGPESPSPQSPVWYVSAGGNNSNSGADPAKPMASVQAALDRIKSLYRKGKWPAGASAVIVISGTITGSGSFGPNMAMADISGAGNYPPIVLRGDPVNGGVLNAGRTKDSEGRALYIANNKVTLGDNLTLTGGYTLWGGAVCVGTAGLDSEGEFVMAGGEISGNTAAVGGGVLVYKGRMSMTGGTVKNNIPTNGYSNVMGIGGGIYLNGYTSFTMTGGTISGNGGAETEKGGGVFTDGQSVFTMNGGEILNNTSAVKGGGVYVAPYGKFIMNDGTISGNASASDGGVSVSPYSAEFNKTGGTISGNTPD